MNQVEIISRRMVQPETTTPERETSIDLTPWDLRMIALEYVNKGILLPKPPTTTGHAVVERLASSLARTLDRFYPYAGRLAVAQAGDGESQSIAISLRCTSEGAELVHAVAPGVTVADVIAPLYTPRVVRSFFPLVKAVGGDAVADSCPLLAVQITELADGIFIGMSLNHVVADGTTFWHFFNTWSEISRGSEDISSALPVYRRCPFDGFPVPVPLPFSKLEDILRQHVTSEHPSPSVAEAEECFFHFSAQSIKKLKAKASAEACGSAISSLQALLAHLWIAVCRARRLAPDQWTGYVIHVGCRGRMDGIAAAYAGNALSHAAGVSTAGEILEKGLGWAASLLNKAVASFDQARERERLAAWVAKPSFGARPTGLLATGSSPRFDVYGNDFGWGRPLGVRSGAGRRIDGSATVYEGRDGGGSMALEVCLIPEVLARLVADNDFMSAVGA